MTWCVCGTARAPHSGKERGNKFHKHCMKKTWSHPTVREEVLVAVFGGEDSLCTFWRVRVNGYQHSEMLVTTFLPLNQVTSPLLSVCRWLTGRERRAWEKERRPWPFGKAQGVCSSLPVPDTAARTSPLQGCEVTKGVTPLPCRGTSGRVLSLSLSRQSNHHTLCHPKGFQS